MDCKRQSSQRYSIDRRESFEADLKVLQQEVHGWVEQVLDRQFEDLWTFLATGVPLCEILTALGHETKCKVNAETQTFYAYDNVAQFLHVVKENKLVPACVIFDVEDLTDRKNPRQVLLCLMQLAKEGIALGLRPPAMLQEELEIQELQRKASLTPADIKDFIDAEDKARKELSSTLLSATMSKRKSVSPDPSAAKDYNSDEQSVGHSSEYDSPNKSRNPKITQKSASQSSCSTCDDGLATADVRSDVSTNVSTFHRVQTSATPDGSTVENGKMTVQLDVDYTLVLQAVQLKHQCAMSEMREQHASQVEEMEALHRRGMLALGSDLEQKHESDLTQKEADHNAKLAAFREEHEARMRDAEDSFQKKLQETTDALESQTKNVLSEKEAENQEKMAALSRTYAEEMETMKQQHQSAIDTLTQGMGTEHDSKVRDMQLQQEQELAGASRRHAEDLEAMMSKVQEEKQKAHEEQLERYTTDLSDQAAEFERKLRELEAQKEEELVRQTEQTIRELEAAEENRQQALQQAEDTSQRKEQALLERLEQEKQMHNEEWSQKLKEKEEEKEKEKAEVLDMLRRHKEEMEATLKQTAEKYRQEKEEIEQQRQRDLEEVQRAAKNAEKAQLKEKDDELAIAVAALRRAHAEELENQSSKHTRVIDGVMMEGAFEKEFLMQQKAKEYATRMQAFQENVERQLATQQARHEEELLRRRGGGGSSGRALVVTRVGSSSKELLEPEKTVYQQTEGADKVVTYISDQYDPIGKMIAEKLSKAPFNGIRLYNHRKRGTYLMKKEKVCTSEFWVRIYGNTIMAFTDTWVDLDSFIRKQFDIPMPLLGPDSSLAVAPSYRGSICSIPEGAEGATSLSVVDLDNLWADC